MTQPWTNQRVAHFLFHMADFLEIKGEVSFKVAAYRRAGESILAHGEDITAVWHQGRLKEIPGVGDAIAKKLDELFRTGEMAFLKDLEREVPPSLATLLEIPGVGPKTARLVWEHLGIVDLEGLERAARAGRLRSLPGLGERAEARILKGLVSLAARDQADRKTADAAQGEEVGHVETPEAEP
ncbi:MAG: helix-hairpin-helix domain-containing protein [Anaerolineae bacterium]